MDSDEYKLAERLKDEMKQMHRFAAACNPALYNPLQSWKDSHNDELPTMAQFAKKIAEIRWMEASAMMIHRREMFPEIYPTIPEES